MDPNKKLHLNFGGMGGANYNNERNYTPTNERVFPTTPSTFPQSVFPPTQANNEYGGAQIQNNYGNQQGGYFPTGAYQPQYNQPQSPYQQSQYQGQYQTQYQTQNLPAPQPSYQQRQTGYNANDPTSNLARQFSNQNLGAPPRQSSPFGRQPSPSSRLYPNSQTPQSQQNRNHQSYVTNQQNQGSLLNPSGGNATSPSLSPAQEIEMPEKNPNKYSQNVQKRGQALHSTVETFFKENIARARDRNIR